MRSSISRLIAVAAGLTIAGCSPAGPTGQPGFTLSWYPHEGTDYGKTIPGFTTLAMCRRAGAGMTMERLLERHGVREEFNYEGLSPHPWFECGKDCHLLAPDSYVIVCEPITEFHGAEARQPRL